MLDPLHIQLYRALVTHGGHTHGVHQPQGCPTCEAMQAYELRRVAERLAGEIPAPRSEG